MSDATREALTAAIQAHVADEYDGAVTDAPLLTDWVLATAAVRMDAPQGATSYSWWSNGGAYHAMRGLVTLLSEWTTDTSGD
jgi:hypothetical protein